MPVTHGVAGSSPVQTAKEKNISFLIFCESEISLTYNQYLGLVVQLVRIHACHAWGRGFESRPDSKIKLPFGLVVLFSPFFLAKGLVVQLVRIHACHAWGRGFESRPDRKIKEHFDLEMLCLYKLIDIY